MNRILNFISRQLTNFISSKQKDISLIFRMRRKSSGTILPDFPDMKNHPAVVKKKFVEQITIHPDSLRNLEEAFVREIEKYMNKWREKYRGVLIKIRSVKLNSELGEVHDEYPFIHCDVLYRTLIFQPERGTQLMGGVTQIFPSHIGLLVFGLYNAIILEENFGNKYAVDEDSEIVDKKTGQKLDVGDEINFTVEKVQSDAEGAFTIYGTFKKIASK